MKRNTSTLDLTASAALPSFSLPTWPSMFCSAVWGSDIVTGVPGGVDCRTSLAPKTPPAQEQTHPNLTSGAPAPTTRRAGRTGRFPTWYPWRTSDTTSMRDSRIVRSWLELDSSGRSIWKWSTPTPVRPRRLWTNQRGNGNVDLVGIFITHCIVHFHETDDQHSLFGMCCAFLKTVVALQNREDNRHSCSSCAAKRSNFATLCQSHYNRTNLRAPTRATPRHRSLPASSSRTDR